MGCGAISQSLQGGRSLPRARPAAWFTRRGSIFGDCFAYALAKSMREPLLLKGNDFSHIDVAIA